jgi:hypothetical protein
VVDDLSVRVKVSPGRVKAEFDDAARVAERTGRPVREVIAEAERRWTEHELSTGSPLHAVEEIDGPGPTSVHDHHDHDHDHHDHPSHDHGEALLHEVPRPPDDDEPA